jgi:hypothetical protein
MVVNWWWLDSAAEGLSEPLFMALLLGSFVALRKDRWAVAAILASFATTVRPVGIFALIAIAIVLLAHREWRRATVTTAIGLVIGFLYVAPLIVIYGNPLANVAGYHKSDWPSGLPVTFPLVPLIKGAGINHAFAYFSKLQILIAVWVAFALAGTIKMAVSNRFWDYARAYATIFAGTYALFIFSFLRSRFYGRPHRSLFYHHYMGNRLISLLFNLLYNQTLSDIEVCYKMFTKDVLKSLQLPSDKFGFEIEISAQIARARRWRIYEVGISYFGRTYDEGKKVGWADGIKALAYLFIFRIRSQRDLAGDPG